MQTTEKLHPEAIGLDKKSDLEILTILYEGQIEAAKCEVSQWRPLKPEQKQWQTQS